MSEQDMHEHLGTIAKSGTKDFIENLKKLQQSQSHELIGQFGVGFYSAFMVADKVEVLSRSVEDATVYKWSSDGKTGYSIEKTTETRPRGAQVILHISDPESEYLQDWKIRELVKKYSNYVRVPIMMQEYDARTQEEKEKNPKDLEFEQVNATIPLWKKQKNDITAEEHQELYQSLSMDFGAPL